MHSRLVPCTVLVLASVSYAQAVPRGALTPGSFQGRIDAAPEGSTLRVPAGYWKPIRIDKPLTLVGDEGAVFFSTGHPWANPFPAPITLDGPGYGQVTLVNLDASGNVDGHIWSYVAGGIVGGGFEALELYQCDIEAPSYWRWHLLCAGGPGISVDLERVLLVESSARASEGKSDCCHSTPGMAGIDAPNSMVELYHLSLAEGAAFVDPCAFSSCPDQWAIDQGAAPGVRARCAYADGTSGFFGSPPQFWRTFNGSLDCYTGTYSDCGWGPYGQDFVKTGDCNFVLRR